mmetsp:Transcript_35540/g.95246  ORF Transcript_35540/g.95246 Transcript_35540/m.95246 type:complete len:217 (-) Transcript_35540:299-949(-)
MCGTLVASPSSTGILPSSPTTTPAAARPSRSVSALRPVAYSTVSNVSTGGTLLYLVVSGSAPASASAAGSGAAAKWTSSLPSWRRSTRSTAARRKRVPWRAMRSTTLLTHCLSKASARRGLERTATAVSKPRPVRKPAHSRAMYAPPTHSVLPGGPGNEKTSSLVIACCSAPGTSRGTRGRPPVATTMAGAVSVPSAPRAVLKATSLGPTKRARAL